MRRLIGVFLFGSALALTACGGGGSDIDSRQELLEHLKQEFEKGGAPAAVADCAVDEFDRRLDLAEIKAAYEKLPSDASDAEVTQMLNESSLEKDVVASLAACARKLGPAALLETERQ